MYQISIHPIVHFTSSHGGARGKLRESPKSVGFILHGNPSGACSDVLVWTKVVNRLLKCWPAVVACHSCDHRLYVKPFKLIDSSLSSSFKNVLLFPSSAGFLSLPVFKKPYSRNPPLKCRQSSLLNVIYHKAALTMSLVSFNHFQISSRPITLSVFRGE